MNEIKSDEIIRETPEPQIPEPQLPQGNHRPYIRNVRLGIAVLFGLSFVMLMLLSLVAGVLLVGAEGKDAAFTLKFMRVITVLQDVLVFILPALAAAFAVTRLPASFLSITKAPRLRPTLMMMLVMVCAVPAMDFIVKLNEGIVLPEALEAVLRASENNAKDVVGNLVAVDTVGGFIVSVLIVGVLTGFSEEIFFRGAFQNLLSSTKLRVHAAIWIAAFVFSAIHMQFYGFFPRLLLGAFFGYLLVWTGSLWVPVIAHALNNTLVIVGQLWCDIQGTNPDGTPLAEYTVGNYVSVALSVAVTVFGIIILRQICLKEK